jgi:hypothetical protein
VKPRIPLAYAGLLVIALVAVVGFAAFSPSGGSAEEPEAETTITVDANAQASARVASAVLALRVSDAENRTATTQVADAPEEATTSLTETPTTTAATTVTESTTTTIEAPVVETVDTTPAPKTDTTPPPLKVTSPDDGDTVTDRLVLFKGTSEPGATVRSGPYPADVDDDGSWSLLLTMSEGLNGAKFTATDAAGNTTSIRLVVTYDPPTATTQPPTTTTTQPSSTPTTTAPSAPKWSPLWPADAGGIRDVEAWRPLVSKYWPSELVECALNVIYLESRGDPRAYNSGVSAEGLFQHLSKYWKGRAGASGFRDSNGLYATPYNAEANIAAAWHIAKNASPWYAPWSVNPFFGDCES